MVLSSPRLDDLDPIQLMLNPNGSMVWANAAGDALRRADRAPVRKLLAQALERGRSAGIIPVPGTSSTTTRYLQLFLTRWGEQDPASPVRATVGLVRGLGWDVTALAARHSELGEHLTRDPLTGVTSRSAFILSLDDHLVRRWRADQRVALFLLDLGLAGAEGKKLLEGEVHDRSLITIAARLTATLRQGDIIGRTDTDSFAVICHGIPDWVALSVVLDRLRAVALSPIHCSGVDVAATIVIDSVFIDHAMHDDLFGSPLEHMVPSIPSRPHSRIRDQNSICEQDAGPEAAADRRAMP